MNKKFKRLLANNVSPRIHREVEEIISSDEIRTKVLLSKMEFLIAKRLLAELPIVPTNERLYELAQDIHLGFFEDISSIDEADKHWEAWVERTNDLLQSKHILI